MRNIIIALLTFLASTGIFRSFQVIECCEHCQNEEVTLYEVRVDYDVLGSESFAFHYFCEDCAEEFTTRVEAAGLGTCTTSTFMVK